MRVILYCRVSSDEQADGTSLDFQERVLREYCERMNYEVIHCCREDFSAKHHDFSRPQMQWLRDYCRKHKCEVDMILFLRWDRFSRNTEFAHVFKRVFMDEMGIKFNAVENPIDFEATEWSTLFNLYAGIAQTENNKISRRTRDGIRETLLKGKCANKAPRGYKNVRTSKHETHVEIDPYHGPKVKAIFHEIAKAVETPNYIRKKFAKSGYNVPEASFFDMLRNPFYMGMIKIPKFKDEPEYLIKGIHEPLVDEETFNKVQMLLDRKKQRPPRLARKPHPDLFLRKFLICPVCGKSLTGSNSRGNGGIYAYYNCSANGKHFRIRADKANNLFANHFLGLKPNSTILNLYNEILSDLRHSNGAEQRNKINKLHKEAETITARLNRIEDKYADGEIDSDTFSRMSRRLSVEISVINEQIKALTTPNHGVIEPNSAKLKYSIALIDNMEAYMRDAPVEVKIKLISSMFPDKIEFDGKNYRTKSYNKVLDLIYQQTNKLRGEENKNGESFSTFSVSVPRPGIEPGWVAPLVFETSASTDSAIWAFAMQRYDFFLSLQIFYASFFLHSGNFIKKRQDSKSYREHNSAAKRYNNAK